MANKKIDVNYRIEDKLERFSEEEILQAFPFIEIPPNTYIRGVNIRTNSAIFVLLAEGYGHDLMYLHSKTHGFTKENVQRTNQRPLW